MEKAHSNESLGYDPQALLDMGMSRRDVDTIEKMFRSTVASEAQTDSGPQQARPSD